MTAQSVRESLGLQRQNLANNDFNADFETIQRISRCFHQSGMFSDIKSEAQAIVKIMAGRELGLGPIESMMGIYIFSGKLAFQSGIISKKIKSSRKYDYRILENTSNKCEIEFFEDKKGKMESVGRSSFTIEEANAPGLTKKDVWKYYPKDLLFARALTRGARQYAPDAIESCSIYTPEELGEDDPTHIDPKPDDINIEAETIEPEPEEEIKLLPDLKEEKIIEFNNLSLQYGMTQEALQDRLKNERCSSVEELPEPILDLWIMKLKNSMAKREGVEA